MKERDRADAVHLRHGEIQDDHIGTQLFGHADGLFAVAGFADDLEPTVGLENHPEDPPEVGYIVYNQYTDGHIASLMDDVCSEHVGPVSTNQVPDMPSHTTNVALG